MPSKKRDSRLSKENRLTIDNFPISIEWENIESVMRANLGNREGGKMYRKFCKWMGGQTCTLHGVWPGDLKSFLSYYPNEAPIYD